VPVTLYDPVDHIDITGLENPAEFTANGPEFSCAMGLALMSAASDCYSIQVLPEALKKKQYFMGHTLFGILAAAVLLFFLGVKLYCEMSDAALLDKDIKTRRAELKKRERRIAEIESLMTENEKLLETVCLLDERIIPSTGLVRTFALIQKYLPDDLWINLVETDTVDHEEFGTGNKKTPVIRIKGSGREMGQPLQRSFTDFRTKLESDPNTSHLIPRVRYGENFSFSLEINYSVLSEKEDQEAEEEEG